MIPKLLDWLPPSLPLARWTPYELLLVLAFSLGLAWLIRWGASQGYPARRVLGVGLFVMLGALLGARWLPWCLSGRPGFTSPHELPLFAYGGFVGGAGALAIGARLGRMRLGGIFDAAAPVTALGLALARIGCFLTGCDYGGTCATTSTLAATSVRYPAWSTPMGGQLSAPAHVDHVARAWIPASSVSSLPIYPVQLYESLLGLFLFVLLLQVDPQRPWRRSFTLAAGYALGRFMLEFIRGDADRGLGVWQTALTSSQLMSVVLLLSLAVLLWARRWRSSTG